MASLELADKMLFAEDLVNYVFRNTDVQYEQHKAEDFRHYVYTGFNEAARTAVRILMDTLEIDVGTAISNKTFLIFQAGLQRWYFPNGFNANNFFPFCVHLATIAGNFYNNGYPDVPYCAINSIMTVLELFDTETGGWDTLNKIAEQIVENNIR